MDFEWDPEKSRINLEKHGIGFDAATAIWEDPDRVEIPARTRDEPRILVVGKIAGKHWSAVVTVRGGRTRIISVRRSRSEEIRIHEG